MRDSAAVGGRSGCFKASSRLWLEVCSAAGSLRITELSSKAAPRQGGRARPGTLVPAVPIYSIYQDDWKGKNAVK